MSGVAGAIDLTGSLVRLATMSLVAVLGAGALAGWVLAGAGGAAVLLPLAVAAGIALVAGWLGTAVTLVVVSRDVRQAYAGIVLGLMARFVFTLGPALALLAGGFGPKPVFLLALAGGKLLVLAVDSVGLARVVARAEAVK